MDTPDDPYTRPPGTVGAASPGRLVAVAIPCYNEERFIASVVLKARRHADLVLVVDDASADQTARVAAAAGADVLRHLTNKGKAQGINTAFAWALEQDVAALVLLDGDGQHDPDEIPAVVAPILRGEADMVVGTRFGAVASDIPPYRQVGQHALTVMTNLGSGLRVTDSQSGFRAFSRPALAKMRFGSHRFAVESEMQFIARKEKLRVVEAPISATYAEPAKRNPVSHGVAIVQALVTMVERRRPLLAFGAAGLALLSAGLLLGLHVTRLYQDEQKLAIGLSLLTVLLVIVGLYTAFVGIILHAIRTLLDDLRNA